MKKSHDKLTIGIWIVLLGLLVLQVGLLYARPHYPPCNQLFLEERELPHERSCVTTDGRIVRQYTI